MAFIIGFILYLPFIVIDMVVASTLIYGCTAVSLTSENTGAIIASVINSASPTSTWLGGEVCVASAVLIKCSTTIIRNQVKTDV